VPVESSIIGVTKPVGEWNTVEMTLSGKRLRIQINDRLLHDVDLHEIADMRAPPSLAGFKRAKGCMGFLSILPNEVQFRNIRIKELPAKPKQESPPEAGQAQSTIPPQGSEGSLRPGISARERTRAEFTWCTPMAKLDSLNSPTPGTCGGTC